MAIATFTHVLLLAATLVGVASGRDIKSHDATELAHVVHRMLQQLSPSPSPSPGSASWQYGTCALVIQDADLVISPAPAGNRDGNLANQPAADVGACCAKCREGYSKWESANAAAVNNIYDNPQKALEALIKLDGICLGWTFVPGPSGANGTCYLKNGVDYQRGRDALAAYKANNLDKLESLLQKAPYFWSIKERADTRGWASGTVQGPALSGAFSGDLDTQIRAGITVLYSEPLPKNTPGCSSPSDQKSFICQKVLGKLKDPSGSGSGLNASG